tara:strand:+ start:1913 stop:2551 length:639 start_codon:yes stop_codon:yes gene_type:complete
MDELELLKNHWQKSTNESKNTFTATDIYNMLRKKSSNIVKTLFYISIGEFIFWILLNILPLIFSDSYKDNLTLIYGDGYIDEILTILSYSIIALFIYLLYKSYKAINTLDNAKLLMENILRTRKIVKYYVIYNLIVIAISMVIGFYISIRNSPVLMDNLSHLNNLQTIGFYAKLTGLALVFVGVIWFFYKLIYGLLLKRLNKNYNELRKLDF